MLEYKLKFTGQEIEEKLDIINGNGIYNVPKDLHSLVIDNNKVIVKRSNDEEGTVLLDANK